MPRGTQPDPPNDSGAMADVVGLSVEDTLQRTQKATAQEATAQAAENSTLKQKDTFLSAAIKRESPAPEILAQQSSADADEAYKSFSSLWALSESGSIEILQESVCVSRPILQGLTRSLEPAKESEFVNDKLKKSETLLNTQNFQEYIVGVVGATGSGKSSLINTFLGETKLIPTNCARACTAVVTEISWNSSEAEEERYTATIDYISAEEWRAELDLLRADLCSSDENGGQGSISCTPEATIAWAKIREVYPYITKEIFQNCTTNDLMSDLDVQPLLGLTKSISASNVEDFCVEISRYIDSREKSQPVGKLESVAKVSDHHEMRSGMDVDSESSDDSDDEFQDDFDEDYGSDDSYTWEPKQKTASTQDKATKRKKKMALWPLINVVRIRTKAEILSSGLVLVDLPGVADSNAARDAVAAQYLKKCDAIWVVASIHRAVDDKVAQNLLGSRFRQQVKLDGNYGNITLVCSKTDDIMAEHAWEQFGLNKEHRKWQKAKRSKQEWDSQHAANLEDMQSRLQHILSLELEINGRLGKWTNLLSNLENGKQAKMPKELMRKRKAANSRALSNKKRSPRKKADVLSLDEGGPDHEDGYATANDLCLKLEGGPSMPLVGEALSVMQAQSMLHHLRNMATKTAKDKHETETKASEYEKLLSELTERSDARYARLRSKCIERRNNFVKKEARRQFEMGLRELDQFEAEKENPEGFDPMAELQDYKQMAADLPVFCVSIREYHQHKNDDSCDETSGGYDTLDISEIPQLAAHAVGLTKQGQILHARQFLTDVFEVLNSLHLWAENQAWLAGAERERRIETMTAELRVLETSMRVASVQTARMCKAAFHEHILDEIDDCIEGSSDEAISAANMWPRKEGNEDGLPWGSYRAICRRLGAFKNSRGYHDFNEDLVAPLKRSLTRNWDKTFTTEMPESLKTFLKCVKDAQRTFHDRIREEIEHGVTPSTLSALDSQLIARAQQLDFKAKALTDAVTELRREANRQFTPAIKLAMEETYAEVLEERGSGCFIRMQKIMSEHVEDNATEMLRSAVESVSDEFDTLFSKLETTVKDYASDTFKAVKQDYTNVLGGTTHGKMEEIIKIAAAKESVNQILLGVERKFAGVLAEHETETKGLIAAEVTGVTEDIEGAAVAGGMAVANP